MHSTRPRVTQIYNEVVFQYRNAFVQDIEILICLATLTAVIQRALTPPLQDPRVP